MRLNSNTTQPLLILDHRLVANGNGDGTPRATEVQRTPRNHHHVNNTQKECLVSSINREEQSNTAIILESFGARLKCERRLEQNYIKQIQLLDTSELLFRKAGARCIKQSQLLILFGDGYRWTLNSISRTKTLPNAKDNLTYVLIQLPN